MPHDDLITYRNTTKAGSTADPRFTLDETGMTMFKGRDGKLRACVEQTVDGQLIRSIPPKNIYAPGADATVNVLKGRIEWVSVERVTAAPAAAVDATSGPAGFDPAVADSLVAIPAMLAGYIVASGLAKKGKAANDMAAAYIAAK